MARRRDTGMVSFDVSVDRDETVEDGALPGSPDPAPRPRLRERWRRASSRRRRALVGVAGGVVLAVAAGAALSGPVTAYAEDQRLRAAPGGVLSLDGELAETWSADADGLAAVLPDGGIVLLDDGAAVAIDVASGEQIWHADLGPDPECGPRPMLASGVEWTLGVEKVTCLHGEQDARTVTVLDADGDVVGQRDLDPETYVGEHLQIAPAADGGLAVVEHDPGLPEQREFESFETAYSELEQLEMPERSATVRVEDALTGEKRFDVPVDPIDPEHWYVPNCYAVQGAEEGVPGTAVLLEEDGPATAVLHDEGLLTTPTLVAYHSCGVDAAATVDGTALGEDTGETAAWAYSWWGELPRQPYPGGGFVVPRASDGSALIADDGTNVLESTERLVVPRATDGTPDRPVLATDDTGGLDATDRDGTALWDQPVSSANLVVSTADAVVVAGWGAVSGLDPSDGSEIWDVETDPEAEWHPVSAVTDGERVTLLVEDFAGNENEGRGSMSFLTVDLATGEQSRDPLTSEGVLPWPVAVDGNLLLLEFGGYGESVDVVGVRAFAAP